MRNEEQHQMDSEVVDTMSTNGNTITRGDLRYYFNLTVNKDNWKLPINREITILNSAERELYSKAVIFFTGSVPKFELLDKIFSIYRITAKGYYVAIGA